MKVYNALFKEVSLLLHVKASSFFTDDNCSNLKYCKVAAAFSHKAICEYILHIPEDSETFEFVIKQMESAGCSADFISTYKDAKDFGARLVCFYV